MNFSVSINGQIFTQNNFEGLAYVQGFPDAMQAIGDGALSLITDTTSTTFTPSGSGSLTVTLDSGHLGLDVGSVVMLRSAIGTYQVGEVTAWNPSTKSLTIDRKFGAGVSASSWTVFQTAGPSGRSGSWPAVSGRRLIDEGGYAGRNGLTRRYDASGGMRDEGSYIPNMQDLSITGSPLITVRDGWRITRNTRQSFPELSSIIIHPEAGVFPWVQIERQILVPANGKGMIQAGFNLLQAAGLATAEWFIGIVSPTGNEEMGITIRTEANAAEYFATKKYPNQETRIPIAAVKNVLFAMQATTDTEAIRMFAWDNPGTTAAFETPLIAAPWRSGGSVRLIIRGRAVGPAQWLSTTRLGVTRYCITEPLRAR